MMNNEMIKLQNTLTGKFFANGKWESSRKDAERIEKNSPTHALLRYCWTMTHVREVTKSMEHGMDLMVKAEQMRRNAGLNRATGSRHTRVKNMMIGRADRLETQARALIFP